MNIEKIVEEYPNKHSMGFTFEEVQQLITDRGLKIVSKERFEDALTGITVTTDQESGESIIYPQDVIHALKCGVFNRKLRPWEWD